MDDDAMKRRFSGFLLALAILPVAPPQQAAQAREAPESFAELAEALMPAVVSISARTQADGSGQQRPDGNEGMPFEEFFEKFFDRYGDGSPRRNRPDSVGSGFIIGPEGHVVTNMHVVGDADRIVVRLDDGGELEATVVGADPKTDIALLKVEADGDLPHVDFGDSDVVRVGDWALAIGNPFGFGNSVTAGIISARQRDINSGPYDEFLQTDAPINRGNSGGPLFSMAGEVIGVNTAIFSPSGGSVGIGFAVPSNIVSRVVDQLMEYGRTKRGWLGVRIQGVTPEIAEAFGLPSAEGALVASVTPDGPAENAGLEAGDVIVTFNGVPIGEMRELPRAVAETEVGREVEVAVIRNGEDMSFDVVLGELEEFEKQLAIGLDGGDANGAAGDDSLGMTIRPATPDIARQFDRPRDTRGLIVTEVTPGGPAARAGILPGDLVLAVGKVPVDTVEQVDALVEAARERASRSIVMRIDRDGAAQFLAVQIGE